MPVTSTLGRPLALALACLFVLAPATTEAQDEDPSPSPSSSPSPITSPEGDWAVSAFDAWEQGLAEPLPDSRLLLRLLADGQLEGETACGRFTGGWSSEGAELSMGVAPTGNLGSRSKTRRSKKRSASCRDFRPRYSDSTIASLSQPGTTQISSSSIRKRSLTMPLTTTPINMPLG